MHQQQRACQILDLKIRSKLQLVNALKDLAQEGLNAQWVFSLTQNLQQLVIGQEIEARESQALGLQVIIQAFLNLQSDNTSLSAPAECDCRSLDLLCMQMLVGSARKQLH